MLSAAELELRYALLAQPGKLRFWGWINRANMGSFADALRTGADTRLQAIVAMMLGFTLAAVGLDPVTATPRLIFGYFDLLKGFDFLIAVIGLFGIGEILLSMEEGLTFRGNDARIDPKVVWRTWMELPRYWVTSLRSSIIGCWMGITPAGATPASFMSYGVAKRISKNPEEFGKGRIEGVIAPETAAHAAAGLAFDSILKVLAEHGANLNAKDKRGQTPLSAAQARSATQTVAVLRSLGADASGETTAAKPATAATGR
mgnify:CR=1 FL=1